MGAVQNTCYVILILWARNTTSAMGHSASGEVNSRSTCHEIQRLLWNIKVHYDTRNIPKVVVQRLTFLLRIRYVSGSNLGSETGYAELGLSWFY